MAEVITPECVDVCSLNALFNGFEDAVQNSGNYIPPFTIIEGEEVKQYLAYKLLKKVIEQKIQDC